MAGFSEIPIEVSIIIPVYNEVENIERLYKEIVTALPQDRFLYEVIFIDDGSTDGTTACLRGLSRHATGLHVVYHKKKFGQSAGLLSGARAARYANLVSLDGDGQNDPKDIPRLFESLKNSNTVVLGIREKRKDHLLRRLSSRIGNAVRQVLLNDGCPDTGCSLKLFPREAFLKLPHFNHLHRFLPALFKRAGFNLLHVPVAHRPRRHGVSKYGIRNRLFVGIYDLIGVRWLLKRPCSPEIRTYDD